MMVEDGERIRGRVHDALGVVQPHPSLRARVMASLPVEPGPSRRPWAMGAVALLLAAAVIGGLILIRASAQPPPAPAGRVVGSLTVAERLDFACTLPAVIGQSAVRIRLPDGQVTVDKSVDVGKVYGSGSAFGHGRWLPVAPQFVSPDGRAYAYGTNTTGVPGVGETTAVYVHDIATGRDRRVWSGPGQGQLLAWAGGNLYVSRTIASTGADELWAVSPNGGAAHRVASSSATWSLKTYSGTFLNDGSLWAITTNQLIRVDLSSGSTSAWLTAPAGTFVTIIGTDVDGRVVVEVGAPPGRQAGTQPPEVLLVTRPNQAVVIADGSDPAFRPTSAHGDQHGIWLDSPGSLWLYRGAQLERVATVPDRLFPNQPGLQFEGGCQ